MLNPAAGCEGRDVDFVALIAREQAFQISHPNLMFVFAPEDYVEAHARMAIDLNNGAGASTADVDTTANHERQRLGCGTFCGGLCLGLFLSLSPGNRSLFVCLRLGDLGAEVVVIFLHMPDHILPAAPLLLLLLQR